MGKSGSSFGFVSARQRQQADLFFADLQGHRLRARTESHAEDHGQGYGEHYGEEHWEEHGESYGEQHWEQHGESYGEQHWEDYGESYRELNDPTVFQGTVRSIDSPVALPDLMRIYALYAASGPEVSVAVGGQTLRFNSVWVHSAEGTAVLRGRIRYEIARARAAGGLGAAQTALASLRGDPQRIAHLRQDLASTRPVESSPYLVEEASGAGVSWACRGYNADGTIQISRPDTEAGCPTTEAAIRTALRGRTDDQARRALYEREQAPTVNRRPQAERARTIATLQSQNRINPGARPGDRLRTRFARLHAAWDIPAVRDTAVYSPLPGRVLQVGRSSTYGNFVRVRHDSIATPVVTNYCHLNAVLVVRRQPVFAGQAVGLAGNTGYQGMAVHLHFSVQRPGAGLSSRAEESHGLRTKEWLREVTGSDTPYARRTGS